MNVRPDGTTCWWTTTEDRTMRKLYEAEGPAAAAQALPGRTLRAVMQRARLLGLKAPPSSRAGQPRVRWIDDDTTDAALRERLPGCQTVLAARRLADDLNRPLYWLRRRAAQLGLAMPASRPIRPWAAAETRLLQEYAHLPAPEISRLMRREGFRRTASAVALRLRRLSIDRTDPDTHTTSDLATLLGVAPQTVQTWVRTMGLRAIKRRTDNDTAGHRLRVRRQDLRQWLREHPTRVDLARVAQDWFMDLALGTDAP